MSGGELHPHVMVFFEDAEQHFVAAETMPGMRPAVLLCPQLMLAPCSERVTVKPSESPGTAAEKALQDAVASKCADVLRHLLGVHTWAEIVPDGT